MQKVFLAIAASLVLLAAMFLSPNRAEAAMPVPTGIQAAIQDNSLIEEAAYVCRRVWRCGYYGCGWTRTCSYTRPYYPYRPHRYYRYRW